MCNDERMIIWVKNDFDVSYIIYYFIYVKFWRNMRREYFIGFEGNMFVLFVVFLLCLKSLIFVSVIFVDFVIIYVFVNIIIGLS